MAIARQRRGWHVHTATNTNATVEDYVTRCLYMVRVVTGSSVCKCSERKLRDFLFVEIITYFLDLTTYSVPRLRRISMIGRLLD
jgi:hypothetical protein